MLNFGNMDTEIPLPNSTARCERCAWSAQSEKKKKIDKLIVAMPLPKFNQKYEREEEKGGERKC